MLTSILSKIDNIDIPQSSESILISNYITQLSERYTILQDTNSNCSSPMST